MARAQAVPSRQPSGLPQGERGLALRASSVRTKLLSGLGEGGGEVGVAHEVAVELKRYEIATPSLCSGLRLIWSLAMTTWPQAGGSCMTSRSWYCSWSARSSAVGSAPVYTIICPS